MHRAQVQFDLGTGSRKARSIFQTIASFCILTRQHPFPVVRHTRAVHQKKKVGKLGVGRDTLGPTLCACLLERQSIIVDVLAGTQCLDGLWKRLRASIGEAHSSGFPRVDLLVRYTQWRTWTTGLDPWAVFPLALQI